MGRVAGIYNSFSARLNSFKRMSGQVSRSVWPIRRAARDAVYCLPLTTMSFFTEVTPLTLRATATALLISAREFTKPVI